MSPEIYRRQLLDVDSQLARFHPQARSTMNGAWFRLIERRAALLNQIEREIVRARRRYAAKREQGPSGSRRIG